MSIKLLCFIFLTYGSCLSHSLMAINIETFDALYSREDSFDAVFRIKDIIEYDAFNVICTEDGRFWVIIAN